MEFSAEVKEGKYDHLLLPSLLSEGELLPPVIGALDRLEEEMTPQDIVDEDRGWISTTTQTAFNFNIHSTWKYLHFLYYFRGPVKNVTNNLTMLIGVPEIEFEKDADAHRWKPIAEMNNFDWRMGYITRNTVLWNDFLSVVFNKENPREPKIRHLPPYFVSEIKMDPDDNERAKEYVTAQNSDNLDGDNVVHHRLDQVGNDKRGVSMFNTVLRELQYQYRHLENLYYLVNIRARLPVIRQVEGGLRGVNKESDRLEYLPGPGRVLVQNKSGDWIFPPSYQGLKGARDVWETFIQAIALAMNLPYFLVSSDYRNNSLASTLSANDPTVKLIQDYRKQIISQIKRLIYICLREWVDCTITYKPVLDRDKKKEAEAYAIGVEAGAVSARTMCEEVFGRKWDGEDGEAQRISVERHRHLGIGEPEPPLKKKDMSKDMPTDLKKIAAGIN